MQYYSWSPACGKVRFRTTEGPPLRTHPAPQTLLYLLLRCEICRLPKHTCCAMYHASCKQEARCKVSVICFVGLGLWTVWTLASESITVPVRTVTNLFVFYVKISLSSEFRGVTDYGASLEYFNSRQHLRLDIETVR